MSPRPRQGRVAVTGAELVYFECGALAAARRLLVHATGFHARCWDGVVRALSGDFERIVALDMRGHGRSSKTPPYDWQQFGADLAAFAEALDLDGAIGVGHSMGGHSAVQAATQAPARFSRLLLVDPVILAPDAYQATISFASAEEQSGVEAAGSLGLAGGDDRTLQGSASVQPVGPGRA